MVIAKRIIEENDFGNIEDLDCTGEIKAFLQKHYLISRKEINNPNSIVFKEKEAYDKERKKGKGIS